VRSVTVAALLLFASACAPGAPKPAPPVRIGAAAPSGPKIASGRVSQGLQPGDAWPNACSMLTDREIQSVLPQATAVQRRPEDQTISVSPEGDSATGVGGGLTARNSRCEYGFHLPKGGSPTIAVTEIAMAEPKVLTATWRRTEQNQGTPGLFGGDRCTPADGSTVSCRKGALYYSIGVDLETQYNGSREAVLRLERNGVVTSFHTYRPGQRQAAVAFENRTVTPELAKTINAKIDH
jgi:hypothetical protein